MGAFYETKLYFSTQIHFEKQMTYDQWNSLPSALKSAALYVNFFNEIYSAWNKTKSLYTLEEDGVSTMMQYLQKNVVLMEENPDKFKPAYIYRVAYNCLYCICHDIKRDRERWEMETSSIVSYGEDELDLFDTVVDMNSIDFFKRSDSIKFWSVVEALGPKANKVVNHLLNGEKLSKVSPKSPKYKNDPLRDVEVKVDEMESILSDLRTVLAAFKEIYY